MFARPLIASVCPSRAHGRDMRVRRNLVTLFGILRADPEMTLSSESRLGRSPRARRKRDASPFAKHVGAPGFGRRMVIVCGKCRERVSGHFAHRTAIAEQSMAER